MLHDQTNPKKFKIHYFYIFKKNNDKFIKLGYKDCTPIYMTEWHDLIESSHN